MAKEAGEKSVGSISYGSKEDCDRVIARARNEQSLLRRNRILPKFCGSGPN